MTSILWFRQDLRLSDNPALCVAVENGEILPVYILDDDNAGVWKMGGTSRVWLHHILHNLDRNLDGHLQVFKGNPQDILADLVKKHGATGILWNRCYEPWRIARDKTIKAHFEGEGLEIQSFNGSLLWEPWTIKNQQGDPYRVFTPYFRKGCLNADEPRKPLNKPSHIHCEQSDQPKTKIDDLGLLPRDLKWHETVIKGWDISEKGAQNRLNSFIDKGLFGYKDGRNFPTKPNVSRLSPYLHWGLISTNTAWHTVRTYGMGNHLESDADHFSSELAWREFSHSLLYHFSALPTTNLQPKFDAFPWRNSADDLRAWQRGMTGCPMVDAGMRELYQTGYMHNRVRMIVGSFLVKNLMLDWRDGEAWFWDCLADADLANNAASWQWIAGCGADAAPYFRVFNCVTQGQKFDPDGTYVRTYIPEIAALPDKYLHCPWETPPDVLKKAGIVLGETYPKLIVDLKESRDRALAAFSLLKKTEDQR